MPKKKQPTGTDADLNLSTLSELFTNEDKAREFFESKRWPNGPVCPRCGCKEVYKITAKPESKKPVRPGVYKCKQCRKEKRSDQLTVRVGSILEDSKLPISKWLIAIHLMTSSKKGVSSHRIARELGITVKSAWFVTMRIREAMRLEPMASMLQGEVEADETYVGGKPRYKGQSKRGRGTRKQPVVALVERDGRVHSRPVDRVDSETLHAEVKSHIDNKATVYTDELPSYGGIAGHFEGDHHTVNHGGKEYVRKGKDGALIHVNNTP